jgi:8-oxo-dGTP pyrophosphatase MutT (NUDIX family)
MSLAARLRAAIDLTRPVDLIAHDGGRIDLAATPVPAAVLIAILTKRPDTMRKHPGQVAFPGGRLDPGDANAIAGALREAEEEIGLAPHHAEIVGTVDLYRTITDYTITPVIAVVPPGLPLHPNDGEVETIFEPPLHFLLDPANHERITVDWQGATRHYWEMHWGGQRIWGATAAMIVNLSKRLTWPL